MLFQILLFALLNYCYSATITSTVDSYATSYVTEVSEGAVQYISPIGCIVTYYDGDSSSSTTLTDCPSDINTVPVGCVLNDCCKTVCPTGEYCTWTTTGSQAGQSSKICDTINCFSWAASGASPRYFCSGTPTWSYDSGCVKTITTSSVITSYYTTVVTTACDDSGGDDVSIPSGCGTITSVISSTTHTYTTCTGSVSPPPGCEFSTTRELTSLLVCTKECTKTFSTTDRSTTVTFSSCPSGDITAPPGFYPVQPSGCSAYSGTVYCPDYCSTYYDYPDYYGTIYTVGVTTCEGDHDCQFITTGAYPSFTCPVTPGAACTKKFTSEGQITTVTLDPCPSGEITPPPNFPAEIIGCTSYLSYYFCPENCEYYSTSWPYYNSYVSAFITSCDDSGCEIITSSGNPSYSCPPVSYPPGTPSPCTRTFSYKDRTTTVSFNVCPSGEITPPPDFTHPRTVGCSTRSYQTFCPRPCTLSGSHVTYYGTPYNFVFTVCGRGNSHGGPPSCFTTWDTQNAETYVTALET